MSRPQLSARMRCSSGDCSRWYCSLSSRYSSIAAAVEAAADPAGRARPGPELPMAHEALNVITILGALADIDGQCARWLDGKARHHNAVWFGPPLNVDRPSGYDRPSRSNALPPRHLVDQELACSRDKSSFASFIFPSMYSLGKVLRAHSVPNSKCDRNGLCICKRSSGVLPHSAASPNITC